MDRIRHGEGTLCVTIRSLRECEPPAEVPSRMTARLLVLVIEALSSACAADHAPEPSAHDAPPALAPWSDAWLAREGLRFIEDTPYRRAALEASLTNHGNLYSRHRLGSYGLGSRGWDLLPVWNPRSQPVTAARAAALERGELPELPPDHPRLWDGTTPTTMAGWVALGRRVFFEFPLRAEVFMEYGLTKPELVAAVGVERTADGTIPGLVVFANIDGEIRVGITCAICHSMVSRGAVVAGAARRSFDYGRLRLAYHRDTGVPVDPEQARRMATWGPGRADVTEDDNEDPVAIPDLWGLRAQRWLTAAGTIRHDSPLALAIRQDTQLIDANHQRIRPSRVLAWALAMYLYSLEPPPTRDGTNSAEATRGARVFDNRCRGCHSSPTFGGGVIAAATIGTNPALATGRGRGTGSYRVPSLLDVRNGAPYLHDGTVSSLAELLSPRRLDAAYVGPRGSGAVEGHRAGIDLTTPDRRALIAFLETL